MDLMGCFSAAEVQMAAARVCIALAKTGENAAIALIDGDVGSMLQQHIKQPDTTLAMFENAALLTSVVVSSAGQVCIVLFPS